MSRSSSRLLATTAPRIPSCLLQNAVRQSSRPFSQTCARRAGGLLGRMGRDPSQQSLSQQQTGPPRAPPAGTTSPSTPQSRSSTMDITEFLNATMLRAENKGMASSVLGGSPYASYSLDDLEGSGSTRKGLEDLGPPTEPFHFHVYAHKHNCHITVTKPNRNAIISMSAGNLGFKKAKRGTYDAAYQLTAYVMDKLNQGNWHKIIKSMEVVLRGFGSGREAATKVLLGAEGKMLRSTIVKVSDATRLKFGGTRSPKPRRLG
ncbi:hypothetical protein DL770_006648 [Monosporascus sp. CRB-9-2]|nr:hypothetical protein DL770_006648 [Monosporascus sp. CRB-9-2]